MSHKSTLGNTLGTGKRVKIKQGSHIVSVIVAQVEPWQNARGIEKSYTRVVSEETRE